MPKSQQPLFDILNQPYQEGTEAILLGNKCGISQNQTEQCRTFSPTQNTTTGSYQSPLVHDTCHSSSPPSNNNDASVPGHEPHALDVTMRREKFGVTGRSERLKSDNMPESSKPGDIETTDKNTPDSGRPSHEFNGNSSRTDQTSSQTSISGQIITNGDLSKISNEQKSGIKDSDIKTVEHDSSSEIVKEDWSSRRPQHYPFRQALSEVILPSAMQRRMSLVNVKEKGYARLEEELMRAHKALERKDEEVDELRGIRERLMKEVSDFTAALFEEVNSQLNEAALSEQLAKRNLKEANAKIDVLTAEVTALKDLVLTSTPSSPNKHLNPQIANAGRKDKDSKPFWKTHRRSTSHHQFTKESREMAEATENHSLLKELDTVVFDEFKRWLLQPTIEFTGQFFLRVQQEDIQPCLNFKNTRLADKLLESVRRNTLSIEPIPGDQSFPRKCCLSESHKLCNYKIKFEGDNEWFSISQMSRNRIAAVCDFYSYLRYIVQGLVKCSDKDIFAELVRLRNQMAQSRLGLV